MTKYLLPNMPQSVREQTFYVLQLDGLSDAECAAEYGADDASAYTDNAAENLAAELIRHFPELAERVEDTSGAGYHTRAWEIAWELVEQERCIAADASASVEFVARSRRKLRKEAYNFDTGAHLYEVTQPKGRGAWTVKHVASAETFTTAALSLAPARIARDAAERDFILFRSR